MTVQLHAFTCGHLTLPRSFLLAGETGMIKVPIPAYLIIHSSGRLLFDTGLHIATMDDPVSQFGDMFAVDFGTGEEIGSRLTAAGIDPLTIDIIINSHLHVDHCGGNAQLPNARLLIQRREVDHARSIGSASGYLPLNWDTGQMIQTIDGEHDVFGDSSVVCLPTYGHTPGHQSLRVRTETGGDFLLCGDACYLQDSLKKLHLPGVVADKEAMLAIFHRLREMQSRGVRIMYGHDPEFWATVPQAPVRLG